MRICLICTEKLPVPPVKGGAIQTYIDGVLPWLSRKHAVTVVCRADPWLPDREETGGVRFVRVPGGDPLTYQQNVADYLQAQPPFDLVEIFNRPAFVPVLAKAAGKARIMLSMHNDMFHPDRIPPETAREVLDRVDRVVTISDYVRETIDRLHPGYRRKLRTIRSGVDLRRFRPVWEAPGQRLVMRRRLGVPVDAPVVLHVSRLSRNKGNDLVIRAMADLRRTHPAAHLLVVGSSRYGSNELDPFGQAVHDEARRLLGGAAHFAGFVPPAAVAPYFLAGDIFVCASQWLEPLARVHYEAMAAGLPIITTDRGGNAEVVADGGTGLIVRPHDDPMAFATHMRTLLDDAALRERMGRRGRTFVEQHHNWERVARELLEVFGRTGGV